MEKEYTLHRDTQCQMLQTGVAIEKLFFLKSAKTRLRQDDLQATFSMRVDVFYPQI